MGNPHPSTKRKPSQEMTGDWIWSSRPKVHVTAGCVGKWLVFCNPNQVDDMWQKLAISMDSGDLGNVSIGCKVNTAGRDANKHVICVYTANYANKDGVAACLAVLRELGVEGALYYKTDRQTRTKQYAAKGMKSSTYSSVDFEDPKPTAQMGMF